MEEEILSEYEDYGLLLEAVSTRDVGRSRDLSRERSPIRPPIGQIPNPGRKNRTVQARHAVWKRAFELCNNKTYKCFTCRKVFNGATTTNALNHLNRCNTALFDEVKKEEEQDKQLRKRPTTRTRNTMVSTLNIEAYDHNLDRYKMLMLRLGLALCHPGMAINSFMDENMRAFINELDPRFELPRSWSGLKGIVDKCFDFIQNEIREYLQHATDPSASLDIWSDAMLKSSYLGMILHTTDLEGSLTALFLGVYELEERHTAPYIREVAEKMLSDYGLSSEIIVRFISDSASNMVAAYKHDLIVLTNFSNVQADEQQDFIDEESIIYTEEEHVEVSESLDTETEMPKRLNCSLHILILALADATKDLKDNATVQQLLELLRKLKKSHIKHEYIISKTGLVIILPPKVRWCYLYLTISRANLIRTAIDQVSEDMLMEPVKWEELEEIEKILKIVYRSLMNLQGHKNVTISRVYGSVKVMLVELSKYQHILAQNLKKAIETRFQHVINFESSSFNPLYVVATFLDVNRAFIIEEEDMNKVIEFTVRMARSECLLDTVPDDPYSTSTLSPASLTEYELELLKLRKDRLQENPTDNYFSLFLREYANTIMFPTAEYRNPIHFWNQYRTNPANEKHLYAVRKLVDRIMPIPASTSAIEAAFSAAGDQTARKKNRTADVTLNQKLVIYKNRFIIEKAISKMQI